MAKMLYAVNPKTSASLTFNNISEAEARGFNRSGISKCVNGKSKTHKGMVWSYCEVLEQPDDDEDIFEVFRDTSNDQWFETYKAKIMNGDIRSSINIRNFFTMVDDLLLEDDIFYDNTEILNDIAWVEERFTFSNGSPLRLLLWQKALIELLYSVKTTIIKQKQNTEDGTFYDIEVIEDHFKEIYVEMARKSGKTELMAIMNIIEFKRMYVNNKQGFDLFAFSEVKDNATVLYNALKMINASFEQWDELFTSLDGSLKVRDDNNNNNLTIIAGNMGRLQSIKSQLTTMDEIHLMMHDLLGHARNAQKANKGGKILMITTAGTKRGGLYDKLIAQWNERVRLYHHGTDEEKKKSLRNRRLELRYCLDSMEEIEDPDNYIKAMPSLGVTYDLQDVMSDIEEIGNDNEKRIDYATTMFNIPMNPATQFFTPEQAARTLDFDAYDFFYDRDIILGADLSFSGDFTSICMMTKIDGIIYADDLTFIPGASLDNMSAFQRNKYEKMIEDGDLIEVPGLYIEPDLIAHYVIQYLEENKLRPLMLAYDQWGSVQFVEIFQRKYGRKFCEAVRQGGLTMNDPFKQLKTDLHNNKVIHNSITIEDAILNVISQEDRNGNKKPDKRINQEKIDPFAALFDAYITMNRTAVKTFRISFTESKEDKLEVFNETRTEQMG